MNVGDRVGAVFGATDGVCKFFGYGTYEGDKLFTEVESEHRPIGSLADILTEIERPNPCIKLDNGKYVWGCECWWGPEDKVRENLKVYKEVIEFDIQEARQAFK